MGSMGMKGGLESGGEGRDSRGGEKGGTVEGGRREK